MTRPQQTAWDWIAVLLVVPFLFFWLIAMFPFIAAADAWDIAKKKARK